MFGSYLGKTTHFKLETPHPEPPFISECSVWSSTQSTTVTKLPKLRRREAQTPKPQTLLTELLYISREIHQQKAELTRDLLPKASLVIELGHLEPYYRGPTIYLYYFGGSLL